jgi:hypothetical protein
MTVPRRIHRLIEGRQLEQVNPDPQRIVGLWQKALASDVDSRKGLSADHSVSLAYQATFQAPVPCWKLPGSEPAGRPPGIITTPSMPCRTCPTPDWRRCTAIRSESERCGRTRSTEPGWPRPTGHGRAPVGRGTARRLLGRADDNPAGPASATPAAVRVIGIRRRGRDRGVGGQGR